MSTQTPKMNLDNVITFKRKRMFREKGKESFFFLLDDFQVSLKTKYGLTDHDTGLIFLIASYQRWRDNDLMHSYIHWKGKKAKTADLEEMLLLSNKEVKNFKYAMKKKDIIREDDYGMYLNEELAVRGKLDNKVRQYNAVYVNGVQSVYSVLVKEDMDNKTKKQAIKDAGLVFSLIPFMNKKTNVLVDEDFNNITMNELKEKLGLGRNHDLKSRLGRINVAFKEATGLYLIYTLEPTGVKEDRNNKKSFRLIINPKLVFSSNVTDKEKLDGELFGDKPSKVDATVSYANCLELLTNDETYYFPTNETYKVLDIRKIVMDNNTLVFENGTVNTDEVLSIHFMKYTTSFKKGKRMKPYTIADEYNSHKEICYI